ncbi:hypothetical protein ACPESR_14460 [Nocardia testacea]|uniref:hypothetical protein n=1 Tax=Nocardia testacea TaxID=248551 RepID=UPI003C2D3117
MTEQMHLIRRSFRGLPFVSDDFDSELLTSMVTNKRRTAFHRTDDDHSEHEYLTPEAGAGYLSTDQTRPLQTPWLNADDLPSERMVKVTGALSSISEHIPAWSTLLRIPIRFLTPHDPAVISGSEIYVPQTIGLGEQAFHTSDSLEASLIHEYAHTWMGLICEISIIDDGTGGANYRLPSGTARKSLRTVLFAAHFAVACGRYFGFDSRLIQSPLTYRAYARDCLTLCQDNRGLTLMGQYVWEELHAQIETN